jgi:hypothetical protein
MSLSSIVLLVASLLRACPWFKIRVLQINELQL